MIGGAGDVGSVWSRIQCDCVGDKNGVGSSKLSVDEGELDLGIKCDTGHSMNCLCAFLKGVEASVDAGCETEN